MKIAFITPEFVTEQNFDGGLANYLGRIAPALAGLGHEVTVLVRANADEEMMWNGVRVCRVAIGGPPLFFLNSVLRDLRTPLDWLWQGWKLRQALVTIHRRERFDIVQYASYSAPGLFRLRRVPAVVRLSSYEPLLQAAADAEPTLARRMQMGMEQRALLRADAVFSPSNLVAAAASARLGRPVSVIESPFSASAIAVDEQPYLDLLAGRRYLLFFGSVGILKGVGTIAAMLRSLLEAHPELHFVFVGKDLGCHGRPMMDLVWDQAGSCRGRVLYLGRMRQPQLLPIVRHAHAVVLPSRVDNLPNSCLEAMAAGQVVVATRGASFEQLLDDGVSGLLCRIDDPQGLRVAIERVLAMSDGEREAVGQAARARVDELAGPAPLQQQLEFYRDCAGKRP